MPAMVELSCKASDLPAPAREQLGDIDPDTVCQLKVTVIDRSVLAARLSILDEISRTARDDSDIDVDRIVRDNRRAMQDSNDQNT